MAESDGQTANQYALVTWLAREFGSNGTLGKKALQKLVYILEAVLGLRTGYSFQLYTYGPFSRDLAGDIDILDQLQGIKVQYVPSENRYIVSAGVNEHKTVNVGAKFLTDNGEKLKLLKESFISMSARELELFSTLHFLKQNYSDVSEQSIVEKLISLKPKYTAKETETMLVLVRQIERSVSRSVH